MSPSTVNETKTYLLKKIEQRKDQLKINISGISNKYLIDENNARSAKTAADTVHDERQSNSSTASKEFSQLIQILK